MIVPNVNETMAMAAELANTGRWAASLDTLRTGLSRSREQAGDEWKALVGGVVRSHPILEVAHENPFVHRCYSKPRGYAGDAVMLDFIYRHPANREMVNQATARGRRLMEAALTTPAPRAVRNRCRVLADEIDAMCTRNPRSEILSIACGHLREAEHSALLAERRFGRFVALDQDPESIATVARDYGRMGIEACQGSVKAILAGGAGKYGELDFVYAAGLYDYLTTRLGGRLLRAMFDMVKPGGKVWIANFMPDIADVGFMEAIMDWWLIFRDADGMRELAEEGLGQAPDVASVRTFLETEANVIFLEVMKEP